jgi:uncharacterized membrane protein (UPF0182 family)
VPFVIAGTSGELDYDGAPNQPYLGTGGIPVGNVFRRAVFAWNFHDINLLLSNQITAQSRLMIYRDVKERAAKAVPFLQFDKDPYLAIVDGNPVWILDAYTTTQGYPYAQSVSESAATNGLIGGEVNYIRNSVKVVVNAYDGSIRYYADLSEPIISVWNRAFPGLFTPIADASPTLQAHFRYPENLLQIQAYQYANYHVTDPVAFYYRSDFWQISPDPTLLNADGTAPPMRPYYQLLRVPGATTEEFQLVTPFVPSGRPNMVAWMAATWDEANNGNVTVFQLPEGSTVEGPPQVFSRMNNDPNFSSLRTLLGQQGSEIKFGDFLVIPVDDSFLYVLPVYVQATSGSTQIPELKRVIVVNGTGGDVSIDTSLQLALANSTKGSVQQPGGNGGNGQPSGTTDQQIQDLLDRALRHFQAADAALANSDLATYQRELAQAQELVQQAQALATGSLGSGTPPTSPTPSPSASVSVSPSPSASP